MVWAFLFPTLPEKFHINIYEENLIIAGSDVRGTVYGIFEVAERLGISPWKWWADVKPMPREILTLNFNKGGVSEEPSVQYRGIFLNDEIWGLKPWSATTFEPEVGELGPKTYENIFQLLLRLKANSIWPAMHRGTKAFYKVSGNNEMARKYKIVVGTSHCEPMLRNNIGEWDHDKYGEYNYFSNSENVCQYWDERITQVIDAENIITLGMRGVSDGQMQGGETIQQKIKILEKIISDQRQLLANRKNKPVDSIAQTVVLYKEVLNLYSNGLRIPVDVTIMWCDDNHGYIRRLSNEEEQKRRGGSGVYYHLSYWGSPHDYLWFSTTEPGLIWYEMSRAHANGARKIWIVNVGDIKPSEYNMELFLDLAWDINAINNDNIDQHMKAWASREFGESIAEDLTKLMNEYYRLAFLRRPEFMGWSEVEPKTEVEASQFNSKTNGNELLRRINMYQDLVDKADQLKEKVPDDRLDAWFQLVEYPIKGAASMNHKFLYAQMAKEATNTVKHEEYAKLSREAYQQIKQLTTFYNEEMSSEKWKHMMSMNPRKLKVFDMPENIIAENDTTDKSRTEAENKQRIFIQANEYKKVKGSGNFKWISIKGLGYSNCANTLMPFELQVRCLPAHSNNFDHQIGIQIDKNESQYFFINTKGRSKEWKQNILRNSQIVKLQSNFEKEGNHSIRLYVNQTGVIIDQLSIDFAMDQPFYEIPYI